jgi:two-component system sensor histidine kinase YesM
MGAQFMKLKLKIILMSALCIISVGVCSSVYLYNNLMNIISNKEEGISDLYLETVSNQLNYNLVELIGLSQCRNDLDISKAMRLDKMSSSKEKYLALRASEKLTSYLSNYRTWRYVDKLIAFNEKGISVQAATLGVNRLDDPERILELDIFSSLVESGGNQIISLSPSIVNGKECIALICQIYDINKSKSNGWLYMEINTDIISDNLAKDLGVNLYVAKEDGTYLLGTQNNSEKGKTVRTNEIPLSVAGLKLIGFTGPLSTAWSIGSVINTIIVVVLTALVAAILMAIVIISLLRESEVLRNQRKNAEITMLQSQINPHFLYNTLESIQWMAKIQKNTGIVKITRCLISLLRNMAKSVGEKISLGEELALLNDYVELQSIRYMDAFEVVNNIPESYNHYAIIKFSIQPLVENAIFHGVVPSGKNGTITINAIEDGNDLLITVTDDGIGIEPPELRKLSDRMESTSSKGLTGIGLSNVNNRYKLSYGEQYGLTFESESGQYTKVIMRFPKEVV